MHLFNEANIVLLPKKQAPTVISDYRPISLINSINKVITKILVTLLALHMNELVLLEMRQEFCRIFIGRVKEKKPRCTLKKQDKQLQRSLRE